MMCVVCGPDGLCNEQVLCRGSCVCPVYKMQSVDHLCRCHEIC